MDVETAEHSALFRPAKRRMFQRARRSTEDGDVHVGLASLDSPSPEAVERQSDEPALTEILRKRKTSKNRCQGIEFSTLKLSAVTEPTMSNSLTTTEPQVDRVKAISDRFVGHTGQVVDVDKHMFVLCPSPIPPTSMKHLLT
jgi:hypothetical protein